MSDLKAQLDALESARQTRKPEARTADDQATEDKAPEGNAPERFEDALDEEVRRRFDTFLRGIEAYRGHPYRRDLEEPPLCWKEGTTRLLDYGAVHPAARAGVPILVIPSLVNRGYILDLAPERSLLRALAAKGFRPFLVDWDRPGERERRFGLTDYVAGRLEGALEAVLTITGKCPAVLGYCMGGLLALALAQRRPRETGPLCLMATPWGILRRRAPRLPPRWSWPKRGWGR